MISFTIPAVRRYLREFLSDPRIIELPRALWWPILNGGILPRRASASAEKYAHIWTTEGSPLAVHTIRQAKLLRGYLGEAGYPVQVDYAMRYCQRAVALKGGHIHFDGPICDLTQMQLDSLYGAASYDSVNILSEVASSRHESGLTEALA